MRDWLSHRVVSSPDDTALIRAEDGEAWTYTDLDRLVSETADRLVAHGIEADDRLGVLTPPYVGTVGLVHAAMRIGATFVPLGQELTERELTERVERADLDAVVCAEPTEGAALGAVEECEGATRSRFSPSTIRPPRPSQRYTASIPARSSRRSGRPLITSVSCSPPGRRAIQNRYRSPRATCTARPSPPRSDSASTTRTGGSCRCRSITWAGSPRCIGPRCTGRPWYFKEGSARAAPPTTSTPTT